MGLGGVHEELKDVDRCQGVSHAARILQVQLRIRDGGPSAPALPTLPSARLGLAEPCDLASALPGMTALPSVNLHTHTRAHACARVSSASPLMCSGSARHSTLLRNVSVSEGVPAF